MIAVDTNVLARFYCDDPEDPEDHRQRPVARRIFLESPADEIAHPLRAFAELAPLEKSGESRPTIRELRPSGTRSGE